ncbi:MAG: hypothetical protein AB2A00_41115 [Myxococcota bacterium]
MSAWRIRPLRWVMVGSVLLALMLMTTSVWLLGRAFGRRADEQAGALTAALELAAQQESARLMAALQEHQGEMDRTLSSLLQLAARPAPEMAPLGALTRVCDQVTLPDGVTRAGVVDLETATVRAWVEAGEKGCVDRWWSLQVQSLTGPPFPAPKDVARMAQSAMFGMGHVVEGQTSITGAHREGVLVHLRHAKASSGLAAFMDFKVAELPRPPVVGGVRLDSFVTVGGVTTGYIHGGPGIGMVPAAVKRIKRREELVNQLPEVAEAAASRAVLAWLFPEESDEEDLAIAGHQVPLEASLPLPVTLTVVSSAPWPATMLEVRVQFLLLFLVAACAQLLLIVLVTRRLVRALTKMATQVSAAWMPPRHDEDEIDDEERARRLFEAMTEGTKETILAAHGAGERFWSAGPLQRLLQAIRTKLQRSPPGPER